MFRNILRRKKKRRVTFTDRYKVFSVIIIKSFKIGPIAYVNIKGEVCHQPEHSCGLIFYSAPSNKMCVAYSIYLAFLCRPSIVIIPWFVPLYEGIIYEV